jgi:NAD(P)-dependent dehydrogenase (short-subunit alcohol dehydrogenase family)
MLAGTSTLTGKTVLVTGANSGIGYAFCQEAVRQGARLVIVAGRDGGRCRAAAAELGPSAVAEVMDVSSLASIDAFVARTRTSYPVIDVLVNNAGVVLTPHAKTAEGFEVTLATNAIGLAHLTNQLAPSVAASPTGRVVIVTATPVQGASASSIAARLRDVGGRADTSTAFSTYVDSKVLACLYGMALQRHFSSRPASRHVLVASCDPGAVRTPIASKMAPGILRFILR